MRKLNKIKIFIAVSILILIVFELIALKNSKAKKMFDITAEIIDNNGKVSTESITVSATDEGKSGTYITLPEYVGTKKVDLYTVKEQSLHNNSNQNTNIINNTTAENIETTNNINSNITMPENITNNSNIENNLVNDTSENNTASELTQSAYSGQNIYLTDTEIKNKKITLNVNYDIYTKENQDLYEQKIEASVDYDGDGTNDNDISIEGYMPLNSKISATPIKKDDIEDSIKSLITNKISFRQAYDIKIVYDEKTYEPTDFDMNVKVTIKGMEKINTENQEYKVVHIDDSKNVTEVTGVISEPTEVTFPAKTFSTYALLLSESDIASGINKITGANMWDGTVATSFKFGSGTQTNPYLITTGTEFAYLASQVNSGNTYEGEYFQLINDIDLNGKTWTPIGTYSNSFRGIFDGLGHTITNGKISLPTSLPTSITSYGLFGSIGGGNSYSIIKNLQVDNISVEINASGTTGNNTTAKGYNIGIITGTMFNHAAVKNVILNDDNVLDNNTLRLRNSATQIFVGGIAGLAVNTSSTTSDPGDGARYKIENCYSNTSVNLDITLYSNSAAGQYAVGGIIGAIRGQPIWPSNCLYKGQLNATNGFTGPIFGYLRGNTSTGTTSNFSTLWNGNNLGNLTMYSYFTSYSTNDTSFSTSVVSGTSDQYISAGWWGFSIESVQGVNKGLYTSDLDTMLTNFNTYVANNSTENYLTWNKVPSSNEFYFNAPLSGTVTKDPPNYTVNVVDQNNTGTYTYSWYIDGTQNTSLTSNTMTMASSWTDEHNVDILIYNGIYYAMVSFTIPKLEIHISFELNNGVLTANLAGTGTTDSNFSLTDYTYKWYVSDITGEETEVEGDTTNTYNGTLENGLAYRVVATNGTYSYMSAEDTYIYGTRTVIYCSYSNGSDYNDGFTPETAVRTLSTAYGKFTTSTTRNENVIVLMGNYTSDSSYLNNASSTIYSKNVTVTGKYAGIDYSAVLGFVANSTYKYLTGDTSFMYLTFNGSSSQTYFYLQGHSLTMGEGITMQSYATSNTNQGLIAGSAPAFHIFAGWLRYDYSTLPRNNAKILIKSGAYGRIILGGSPGTTGLSNIEMYTSHDFIGSNLTNDCYSPECTIDIKNSTKGSYTYDINLLSGGSACGNIYGNITTNIKNGSIGRLLGASIGDSSDKPDSSEFDYPINTFIGTTTVNMTGGSVVEMYGGCLGRNMDAIGSSWYSSTVVCDSYFYGTVNLNISGGTITNTIYGAGAGGVSGYSAASSDTYKSYGQSINTIVNINISGGTINADVYGGGYGYTEYLTADTTQADGGTLYGDSNIIITGLPTITGNIYAGGRGYNLSSDKTLLAQMEGNSHISIDGSPTISGSIYGAGMGLSDYADMAKLTGTTILDINADLSVSVFGGGNIAKTIGTTTLNIGTGTHTGDIYGGGNVGLVDGTTNVNVNNGTNTTVYGGGNQATATTSNVTINGGTNTTVYGGGNHATVEKTTVTINSGTNTTVYAGGNQANVTTANLYIPGGTTTTAFGGGNSAGVTTTNVYITGGTVTTTYGGSNNSGDITTANVEGTSGNTVDIFGGNNAGGTCTTTNVTIAGVIITDAVYGGGNAVATDTTNLYLNSSYATIPNAFGGGNQAGVTSSNVQCNGASVTNIFGGSNTSGQVTNTDIKMNSGTVTNIYGGNNLGGTTGTSTININGGTTSNVYGGGNQAIITTTNINMNAGSVNSIFGGGNEAGATTTNVNVLGGTLENAYGGSNHSGTVETTNVTLNSSTVAPSTGVDMTVKYTADATQSWQTTSYPTHITVDVTYKNNTSTAISTWSSYVDFPNSTLWRNYSQSAISEENSRYTITQQNHYYGTNTLTAGGSLSIEFELFSSSAISDVSYTYSFLGTGSNGTSYGAGNAGLMIYGGNNQGGATTQSNVTITNGAAREVYGGNNRAGDTTTSNVIVNGGTVNTVYGGNNLGGTTTTSNVTTNAGTITDVYGGGNQAVTGVTNVNINSIISNCVYGGGNAAGVNTNTTLNLTGANVTGNVYGGGNEGTVTGNTNVHVKNSILGDSLYAGGNGSTAVVIGNTNLIMDGTTNSVTNSVFGGGNQAATGTETSNNSASNVNIVGATIGKNVYGGANTSVVYGTTLMNLGYDTVGDNTLTIGDVVINGTIFGGGEANASGSEVYDFSFISVTNGITMNINGNGHTNFSIKGSIFGSGNASSTSGNSYINIKNYGSVYSPESNVSIQRATTVTLDNSSIALSGTKDRTNEYSDVFFALSRIDELKLKNNSILYMNYGANLLKKLTSCVDVNGTETKAAVTIADDGTTTKNVDNRIYMAEGKNLNIATNENVTAYGEVSGMTFFGLFTNTMNPSTSTGLYNKEYNNGDSITNAGTFSSNSYVLGLHKTNHDTTIDGFYSNYDDDNNTGHIKCKYIETTPKDDVYYIWLVGVQLDVTTFEITLTGSKYATLGTDELTLTGFATPNSKYMLNGFSAGLSSGISLVQPSTIENVASSVDTANSVFGLSMKTGNTGWSSNGSTNFLTTNGGTYSGNSTYKTENSTVTPTLNFCLYHSENITLAQTLGSVKIRLQVQIPVDDLNYRIAYIDINITMTTALYQDDYFEGAISPGEQFSLFTTTETNITASSIFSTYYSLYIPNYTTDRYYGLYENYKHVLVSRNSSNAAYVFPANTKITMIDMVTNKYYYYVVTDADVASNKYVYNLTDFNLMGSSDTKYDETEAKNSYHNTSQDLIYENFIFHVDFGQTTGITTDMINNNLLMELRDNEDQTLIGVLGIQRDTMKYSVYTNKDATIDLTASLSNPTLYRGKNDLLTVSTTFTQTVINSKTIYDTHYFDKKMGIKISIYDNNGNRLNSDSLLGVSFTLDGVTYYPRIDGTVRIKIADKVSNVLSKITIDTSQNTTLATGDYTIKVDSFGSPDGIYYGVTPSDTANIAVRIIDSSYGLKVYTDDKSKIVNKTTGFTEYGNNSIWTTVNYSSALTNPSIAVALYRRDYTDIYTQTYSLVDLADYVTTSLTKTSRTKEYVVSTSPAATSQFFLQLKTGLKTGTYKLVFKLYDSDSYIGEDFDYLIIK